MCKDNMFYLLDLAPLVVPQLALHDDSRLLICDVVSLLPFRPPVLEPDFNLKIVTQMISTIYTMSLISYKCSPVVVLNLW